ncbi:hypothetical protein [Streptomyces sp. NPDC046332]|uniref:hypothetical protein n=1 Tax=Streptomyces sp. NPDC046332 TaxID=3155133 RepID=UPI0033F20197
MFIEVLRSGRAVHRRRLEGRSRKIEGFHEPAWEAVERRQEEFAPWADDRLLLDSVIDMPQNIATALEYLAAES